jgi:hypothetical protein
LSWLPYGYGIILHRELSDRHPTKAEDKVTSLFQLHQIKNIKQSICKVSLSRIEIESAGV